MLPEGLTFTVCWTILPNGSNPVYEYLESLADTDKPCFASVLNSIGLLHSSDNMRSGLTRPLKGKKLAGIHELRVMAGINRHYARLPLFLTKSREVVLLFGETKKGAKPSAGFLDKAVRYRQLIINQEATYEQINPESFD
jgi:hypothetical protein